jgi:hypothetical protein
MKRVVVLFLMSLTLPWLIPAETETIQKKVYVTRRVNPRPPVIDGKLDDPAWDRVEWGGDFVQREPYEGQKPSQETAFKILYDDKNFYVGIRAYDTEPDKIVRRLTRRDTFDGDWVEINIDSYFDRRTAFSFTVNAVGVKGDEFISNDGDRWDTTWDPIWYTKTAIDELGWTAEMRIPLDQLRYGKKAKHIWGIQFTRRFFRKQERSVWQFIPKDAPGWVHLFGELHGIEGIKAQRQFDLFPYVVAQHQRSQKEEGNPFATGHLNQLKVGLDGKIGLTSDMILDFTVNPDFGQVEADPSEINLTAFETYFHEKRPFFIESRNITDFQISGGDSSFSRDNLFYSRRIGRIPHYDPEIGDEEYVDMPQNTSIIAAFKLTGKTRKGLSIGVLDAVTAREKAEIDLFGERRHEAVEPMTNYFGLRLQKDYHKGNTILGGMFTATNRDIRDPQLDFLHRAAYTGGLDFSHRWRNRDYHFSVKTVFSYVQGEPEAILKTQTSSLRYFQRPDADHVELDPDRTSLFGHGGTVEIGKFGGGHFRYSTGITWRSPGLALNDMGYLREADKMMQWVWVGYRVWKPFGIFRKFNLNLNQYQGWDFGGSHIFKGGNININGQFKNYWGFGSGIEREGESFSNSALRGGPALRWPGGWDHWFDIESDHRKKIRFHFGGYNAWGDYGVRRVTEFWGGITFQPSSALSLSLYPSYSVSRRKLQYIDTVDFTGEDRYLFGKIDQETAAVTIRLNFSITPDLSIQFYGQPFISAGKYSRLKRITQPRADAFSDRFHIFEGDEIHYDAEENRYDIDENVDGAFDYGFENPDFDFFQFRSNLVVRWEYTPGSVLYLVWSQNRTGTDSVGIFAFADDLRSLFRVYPTDVFLLKFTHRF